MSGQPLLHDNESLNESLKTTQIKDYHKALGIIKGFRGIHSVLPLQMLQ